MISGDEGPALSRRTIVCGRPGAVLPLHAREPAVVVFTVALTMAGHCIRRLECGHRALTDGWIGLGTGLEQAWTLVAAPVGEGPLYLEVSVEDALSIEGGGEDATIVDAEGRAWSVGSTGAWDAEGEPRPARLLATEDGLRIEVDDAGAEYRVEIDLVYALAAWTDCGGGALGTPPGYSLSAAGDQNADGHDDVFVGAAGCGGCAGRRYVDDRSWRGLESAASTRRTGVSTPSGFGSSSGGGEVKEDGCDAPVVGADDCGCAFVYPGFADVGGSPDGPHRPWSSRDVPHRPWSSRDVPHRPCSSRDLRRLRQVRLLDLPRVPAAVAGRAAGPAGPRAAAPAGLSPCTPQGSADRTPPQSPL